VVVQEAGANGGPNLVGFYHGCPGPEGNKGVRYSDSTTADGNPSCGNIRVQHVEGFGGEQCCYNGNQADCVRFDTGWTRYWMHVVVGPSWLAADDRIQMYVQRAGDAGRILVYDTDISKNFGDTFLGKLTQCGACTGSPGTPCHQNSDCGGSGTCDLRYDCAPDDSGSGKYGKIWINEYTSALIGTPSGGEIAYTWYDNLLITRTDPESVATNPPGAPQGFRAN
jgi:hypothetical protein